MADFSRRQRGLPRAPVGTVGGDRATGANMPEVQNAQERFRAEQIALNQLAINNPADPFRLASSEEIVHTAAAPQPIVDYVAYTVPAGRILVIDKIGVEVSRPWIWSGFFFGWRLARNGAQIHGFQPAGFGPGGAGVNLQFFFYPLGSPAAPAAVRPIYFPAGSTVSIQGQVFGGFENYAWVSTMMNGWLFEPASPVAL